MDTEYWIGTSGWTYDHWKGDFYPSELPRTKWFEYYARQFNSVEINATFYRWFKDSTFDKWREQVGEGFKYTLKVPRQITHVKMLINAEEDIRAFTRSAGLLGERLGAILLQLPPGMPYDLARLRRALLTFGEPARLAVEFRNRRWLTPETESLLVELGAAWCDLDTEREPLTGKLTSTMGYIRLHGPGPMYASDYSEGQLEHIAHTARTMSERGARQVYIYFNNDLGGFAPRNAGRISQILAGTPGESG